MKLKTEQEIFEIATKDVLSNYEIEDSRKSIPSFTAHAMIDSFVEGAKWMQSDLLESASDGFKQWWDANRFYKGDFDWEEDQEIWQECSLHHTKLIKEKDERIKELKRQIEAWETMYKELMLKIVGN